MNFWQTGEKSRCSFHPLPLPSFTSICPFNNSLSLLVFVGSTATGDRSTSEQSPVKIHTEAEVDVPVQSLIVYDMLLNLTNLKNSWN